MKREPRYLASIGFIHPRVIFLAVLGLAVSFAALAEAGGSAEPLRIKFKYGASAATMHARLSGNEEFDYVFGANAGQTVKLTIESRPKGRYASFYVRGDSFDFSSGQDANYDLTFVAPATGDYLVTVRNQSSGRVKSATFLLTLAIN